MKIIKAFLRLVRWPNLVFIALTQVFFQICIDHRIFIQDTTINKSIWLLIIASVFIAAAGYIINDYFDLDIDQINKPEKVVVNNLINRRWVIFWHMTLSLAGIYFTFLAFDIRAYWHLIVANIFSVILLWVYSTSLKKKLLIGNVLISVLTAWVIGILYFAKYPISNFPNTVNSSILNVRFFRLSVLYAGFAFVISLIREVIKDLEDMEGDRKYGGKTMPILWGVQSSKVFIAVWLIVLIFSLFFLQLYVIQLGWWLSVSYCLILIILPLCYILNKLFKANKTKDYHHLSVLIKMIMLAGIFQ